MSSRFEPFVAQLGRGADRLTSEIQATMMFADVSGYTRLTERLAATGREGAEVLTTVVNRCFTVLIDEVESLGGDVVRFGGDALFIVFTGEGRIERGAVAAARMQAALKSLEAVQVPGGPVRLRMSVGLNDGTLIAHPWVGEWAEVLPLGSAVTETLQCEAAAQAGEVRVGPSVADRLGSSLVRDGKLQLAAARRLRVDFSAEKSRALSNADQHVPPALRWVLAGDVRAEHRAVSVAFILLSGTDQLASSAKELESHLDPILDALGAAVQRFGVVPISTDVSPDGLKIILATGVPTATEDDEERLLLATQAIVAADQRCSAGLHTGVVFCGEVGHPRRRTFTIMGDAVNVAARLMGKAPKGNVLASAAILDSLGGHFATEWLEPFAVKGKQALQLAAIVGDRLPEPAPQEEVPFRGRVAKLKELATGLEVPGLFHVTAAAGFGATRFVREAMTRTKRESVVVTASIEDRGTALAVARRMLRVLGATDELVSKSTDPAAVIDLAVLAIAEQWRSGLLPDGLVLVVDRVHHADEASVAVLRGLSVVLAEVGGRIIIVGRSKIPDDESAIEIGPLNYPNVRQLCIDASLRPLSDAELEAIVARCGGSPTFAQQLARLERSDTDLPSSMESLVAARIDQLPGAVRQVVREAAVLGPPISIDILVNLTGRDRRRVMAAVRDAQGIVVADESGSLTFEAETVREVAAAGMPLKQRRPLHQAMAELLAKDPTIPPAQVAHHFYEAGDLPGTVTWCERAARLALAGGASASAALQAQRSFSAAKRVGAKASTVVPIALLVADASEAAGLTMDADAALAAASAYELDAHDAAMVLVRRSRIARDEGRTKSAAAFLARAAKVADPMGRIDVEIALGFLRLQAGDSSGALRCAAAAVELASVSGQNSLKAQALILEEITRSAFGLAGHLEAGRDSMKAALLAGDPRQIAKISNDLALSADNRGDWSSAVQRYSDAEQFFDLAGDVVNRSIAATNRATIQLELGEVDALLTMLPAVLRILSAAGFRSGVASCEAMLARATARAQPSAGAAEAVVNAASQKFQLGETESGDFLLVSVAELHLLGNRPLEALELIDDIFVRVDSYGPRHLLPVAVRRLRAVALASIGQVSAARKILWTALIRADQENLLPERCFVRWALAQVEGGLSNEEAITLHQIETQIGAASAPLFPLRQPPI
jgi:class 3 adenylate cyclase/tetratricopeptide (TPR) repeat protein